jgi:hypothetical protein
MQTTTQANTLLVKIVANDKGNPAGKLADAESTSRTVLWPDSS